MSDEQRIAGIDQRTLDLAHHAVELEQEQAAQGHLVPYARDLAALPDGERVKDVTGDVWEKRDGWWCCLDASLRGEALLRVWGPVTRTQEPAIVTYGQDQG